MDCIKLLNQSGLKDNSNYRTDGTVKLHMILLNIRYEKESKPRNFNAFYILQIFGGYDFGTIEIMDRIITGPFVNTLFINRLPEPMMMIGKDFFKITGPLSLF